MTDCIDLFAEAKEILRQKEDPSIKESEGAKFTRHYKRKKMSIFDVIGGIPLKTVGLPNPKDYLCYVNSTV